MENTCSEYLRKLLLENPDVGERYQMKLKLIGDFFYTREQMKAFKSLQAYKYFEAGFVVKAGTKMANDFYILVGKTVLLFDGVRSLLRYSPEQMQKLFLK